MSVEIRLENIVKIIGSTTIVDGVSLRVPPGEMAFVLGPSGCGKTTLLRMVAGLTDPTRGRVWFGEREVTGVPTRQRNLGMVFQSYALWPHMTVLENVAFGLQMRKVAKGERGRRARAMLESVGLAELDSRKPAQLSGGQQQRVALARALVVEPDVLLLDEPLSNLDANLRVQLRELIRRLCSETGVTTLYVTHDQEEAMALADEIVVMRTGRIEQTGAPTEIYARPQSTSVAQFLGEINLLEARVASVNGAALELETELGAIRAGVGDHRPRANDLVSCCIRPESIRVIDLDSSPSGENHFVGKVTQATRRGLWSRLVVEVKSGRELIVHEPGAKVREPDQRCGLAIESGDVVVLPHDGSRTSGEPARSEGHATNPA